MKWEKLEIGGANNAMHNTMQRNGENLRLAEVTMGKTDVESITTCATGDRGGVGY